MKCNFFGNFIRSSVIGLMIIFPVSGQERWFDSYSLASVTQQQERYHLDDFAYYLLKDSTLRGYVAYFVGKGDSRKVIQRRAERNRIYLQTEFRLEKSRIVLVYAGRADETKFILQPLDRISAPPDFTGK